MKTIFFLETEALSDNSIIFEAINKEKLFFSYFQVDQNYYLLVYGENFIDIDFFYKSIDVVKELDRRERKIRSLRGFFIYALEIIEVGKDFKVLKTNLQPFFWKKLKNVIRQNKKSTLLEFLFGSEKNDLDLRKELQDLKEKIERLQDQGNSLQQKITQLENQVQNLKRLSEAPLRPEKASFISQQYNLSSNPNQIQNFKSLKDITEEQLIEIIKTGFRLNKKAQISIRNYYEGTEDCSLLKMKGYSIKHETIRRTKLYKDLKKKIKSIN